MRDRSLRVRLRVALITGAAVLALAAILAGTALVIMRDRLDAITQTYFLAITEADAGHLLLQDLQASVQGYAESGDSGALAVLERVTGQSGADGETPDTESMLAAELGVDHPVLRLRQQASDALDAWYGGHVEPLVAAVEQGGTDAVSAAQLQDEQAAFAELETLIEQYSAALRQERAAANDELRTWIDVTTGSFVVLTFGALVAGALLWVFLRRWVTDPVTALAADTRRVTAGEVQHVVEPVGVGEIAAMARDVEAMRARLVVHIEESARARRELELSHAALEEQAEDLRRSNRDLEQFAYVASHDLQEPLRKVASFTQLLSTRYSGQLDERADQYIAFAVDGAKRMQRLINDLLGFSRVGRIGTEVSDVDLRAVVRQVVADLSPVIEETGAEVAVGDLPVVRGEAPLLTQLIANLLGNSLKFRDPDRPPRVRFDAHRVGGYWEFVCEDNGIGIDAKYVDRVFVIFQRLHPKDVYEGTGIGLALCKKIVEYHGGHIWIDVDTAEGTAIRWTLPAEDTPTAALLDGAEDALGEMPDARADGAADGASDGAPPSPVVVADGAVLGRGVASATGPGDDEGRPAPPGTAPRPDREGDTWLTTGPSTSCSWRTTRVTSS